MLWHSTVRYDGNGSHTSQQSKQKITTLNSAKSLRDHGEATNKRRKIMTRATVGAVAILSPFSCGDVLRGYNKTNVFLPSAYPAYPAYPAYWQAGGRQATGRSPHQKFRRCITLPSNFQHHPQELTQSSYSLKKRIF